MLSLTACGAKVASSDSGHDAATPDAHATHDAAASKDTGTGLPDGACRLASDCPDMTSFCGGPVTAASLCLAEEPCGIFDGGICPQGEVCSTGSGAQTEDGGLACRPPCGSNDDCNYWEACDTSTGLCGPLSCDKCPSYLSCTTGSCAPKACNTDSQCPGGFCVDNTCFATLGSCEGECG